MSTNLLEPQNYEPDEFSNLVNNIFSILSLTALIYFLFIKDRRSLANKIVSSGKPPFHNRKHDGSLALAICNGLRPEFGKGTPEFYKKLAYRCMNANPDQRPTADELHDIIYFWYYSIIGFNEKKFGYKGEEIKSMFKEADKEIPNISTSYEKDPDAIYTSRLFTFSNLTKPINSSIITSYLNDEENNKGIVF